jgi:hypothetical protein
MTVPACLGGRRALILDELIDDLAKDKAMEKILRKETGVLVAVAGKPSVLFHEIGQCGPYHRHCTGSCPIARDE